MWQCWETPYWLVENNKEEEARQSLQWYRGKEYDITEEIEEIIDSKVEKDRMKSENNQDKCPGGVRLINVLGSRTFLTPFSCAGVLYLLAQLTGISTMVFYMTNIFQESGSSIDPHLAPVIVAAIRVVTAGFAAFVLRYASRRHLFVLSTVIIFTSTFTIATISYMRTSDCCLDTAIKENLGYVPLLAVIAMFVGHALGVVPVCQLVAAEVFPTEIRTLGSGLCVAVATVANAINSKVNQQTSNSDYSRQFLGFSIAAATVGFPRHILDVQHPRHDDGNSWSHEDTR